MSKPITPAMRRSVLISVLRDESLWSEGFEWYFDSCQSCAMGLLDVIFGLGLKDKLQGQHSILKDYLEVTGHTLDLDWETARKVFGSPDAYEDEDTTCITPKMVADMLEKEHKACL